MRHRSLFVAFAVLLFGYGAEASPTPETGPGRQPSSAEEPLSWPEEQQRFWFEGPAWLLPEGESERLRSLSESERGAAMEAFLARDPLPETPESELREAIQARRALLFGLSLSTFDERGRLLFLHGEPDERFVVDCLEAFKPLEIWRYGEDELILYRPNTEDTYRLWLPFESKRALYTRELAFWLEEWEIYKGRISGRRVDRRLCPESKRIDEVTGVEALSDPRHRGAAVDASELLRYLHAPDDLAAWTRQVLGAPAPLPSKELRMDGFEALFTERQGVMMETTLLANLPGAAVEPFRDEDREELRIVVEGVVETGDAFLDDFRIRFVFEPPAAGAPIPLAVDQRLRAGHPFRIRLRVKDEIGGGETLVTRTIHVPTEARRADRDLLETVLASPDRRLDEQLATRPDGLVLLVPPQEVVFGGMRAQAAVRGPRIEKVTFFVDGQPQVSRNAPPWTVELVLPRIPRPMTLRAEGYDEDGELVAADEVFLNQPRGSLAVEILEPERGAAPREPFDAEARITVPEGRRIEWVEFRLDEEPVVRLTRPPWTVRVPAPDTNELSFLTVEARLDDDSRSEDVRFLNTPHEMGEVDVQMVELYTTVIDRRGGLARGLGADAFSISEDGRPQQIAKFDVVEDMPLTVGVTLDVSGSMFSSLGEAQRAAVDFLEEIVTPRDRAFAVAFASEPRLAMPRTEDVGAVAASLENLRADGYTALHDAVVFSLYYFSGSEGRRVLVLLSDGDDTDSRLEFDDALEYARQSPVVIYTIGLETESLDANAKRKLRSLARETGGRSFFIREAGELHGVYDRIAAELRSQYLLAYFSDGEGGGGYRTVEVEVRERGLEARTIQGYYP